MAGVISTLRREEWVGTSRQEKEQELAEEGLVPRPRGKREFDRCECHLANTESEWTAAR